MGAPKWNQHLEQRKKVNDIETFISKLKGNIKSHKIFLSIIKSNFVLTEGATLEKPQQLISDIKK